MGLASRDVALQNLGAASQSREWGKLLLSALAAACATLYLLWLYAFILYIDI